MNDRDEITDYITWDRCDSCGVRRRVVMMHHNGTPVLTQCSKCHPHHFSAIDTVSPLDPFKHLHA